MSKAFLSKSKIGNVNKFMQKGSSMILIYFKKSEKKNLNNKNLTSKEINFWRKRREKQIKFDKNDEKRFKEDTLECQQISRCLSEPDSNDFSSVYSLEKARKRLQITVVLFQLLLVPRGTSDIKIKLIHVQWRKNEKLLNDKSRKIIWWYLSTATSMKKQKLSTISFWDINEKQFIQQGMRISQWEWESNNKNGKEILSFVSEVAISLWQSYPPCCVLYFRP